MIGYDDWKLSTPDEIDHTCNGWWSNKYECKVCGGDADICSDVPEYNCSMCGFEFKRDYDMDDVMEWALKEKANAFMMMSLYKKGLLESDVRELFDDEDFVSELNIVLIN